MNYKYLLPVLCVLASCNVEEPETGMLSIPVRLSFPNETRSSLSGEDENAVSGVQILVFREDGRLDSYTQVNGREANVICTAGKRQFVAVVNAPSFSDVADIDRYNSRVSGLEDNEPGNFVMTGDSVLFVAESSAIALNVSRLCSKITIKSIRKAFSSQVLQEKKFLLKRIYLTNAVGSLSYCGTPSSTKWYNRMGYEDGCPQVLYDEINAEIDDCYDTEHSFYVYPNPSENNTRGGSWSERVTRLVLDVTIDARQCYYVIDLPCIERNTSYVVSELTISRPGAEDEESVSEEGSFDFLFSVQSWGEGAAYQENL